MSVYEGQGGLIDELRVHLEEINNEPHTRALEVIHCSEVFYCPRAIYYCRLGEMPVDRIKPDTRLIFDTGHAVHGQLQGYLTEHFGNAIMIETECGCPDPPLRGHIDGVLVQDEGDDIGIEIKSIKDEGFNRPPISGSVRGANQPFKSHLWQVHCYMWATGLRSFIVLYYNKNTSEMKEFLVEWDDSIWSDVMQRINLIEEAVAGKTPPKGTAGRRCSECRYQHICDEKGAQKWRTI